MSLSPTAPTRQAPPDHVITLALIGYTALIIYGSIYPLTGWREVVPSFWSLLREPWPKYLSRSDIFVNLTVYAPLGYLATLVLRRYHRAGSAVLLAMLAGLVLSLLMEGIQRHLPTRVASMLDVLLNMVSALGGALAAVFTAHIARPETWLARCRHGWFLPGKLVDLGLATLLLWLLFYTGSISFSDSTPLLPHLAWLKAGTQFLLLIATGWFVSLLVWPGLPWLAPFTGAVLSIAVLKALIHPTAWLLALTPALAAIVVLAAATQRLPRPTYPWAFMLCMAIGLIGAQLSPSWDGDISRYSMNWIPFRDHMIGWLGLLDILATLQPFLALGIAAHLTSPLYRRKETLLLGSLIIALSMGILEWTQQFLPGRQGDITDVILAVTAWGIPWLWRSTLDWRRQPAAPRAKHALRTWSLSTVTSVAVVLIAFATWYQGRSFEQHLKAVTAHPVLPPEQLPPVVLPHFVTTHPRLPHPTSADAQRLQLQAPHYLQWLSKIARGGRGNFYEATQLARLQPGSIDLDILFNRLIRLHYEGRGHDQAMPLALAYDWLYDSWTAAQRAALRDKLAEGIEYISKYIHKERLSPYNVILYNSPLQGLMAASLALYGDDPRAEMGLRYTYELWKNRVLPVWQQVMGQNGGWHEGGEYVGIGIGQAIYTLPAMWRAATGEDVFRELPGLRGMLDFAVYRTRPDGSQLRMGDAAFFDRFGGDFTALATELRHAAAYTLRPSPNGGGAPAGWPWTPPADSTLINPDAASRLPLSKLFDGIGLLVARSDWSPDATYVTFNAGDNFWSHQHLDQGNFTIYKGGALAIDSGYYGPKYGSDHHMNYTYQSIAHNLITVTDPADNVPAPGKEGSRRPIANDGGQRRIGSGWGVEQAPLSRDEWQAKRELYHTGAIARHTEHEDISVVAADLTPAYTNRYSGTGTFSHRTRRVERLWRTFSYDRRDDAIVIFDQVISTRPDFVKRWLLHSQTPPQLSGHNRFTVQLPATSRPGQAGGRLEGLVLWPPQAQITLVGGPGQEFLVGGKNYDENGKLSSPRKNTSRAEPGAWRVEVIPSKNNNDDIFLTVLLPTLGDTPPPHHVRLLEENGRIGCEIRGPQRLTRWWFTPGTLSYEIEIVHAGTTQRQRVDIPSPAPPPPRVGWWERWFGASE